MRHQTTRYGRTTYTRRIKEEGSMAKMYGSQMRNNFKVVEVVEKNTLIQTHTSTKRKLTNAQIMYNII